MDPHNPFNWSTNDYMNTNMNMNTQNQFMPPFMNPLQTQFVNPQQIQNAYTGDPHRNRGPPPKSQLTCGNCQRRGHGIKHCKQIDETGFVPGCPRCNTIHHDYDECTADPTGKNEDQEFILRIRANGPPLKTGKDVRQLIKDMDKRFPPDGFTRGKPWTATFALEHFEENPRWAKSYDYAIKDQPVIADPAWRNPDQIDECDIQFSYPLTDRHRPTMTNMSLLSAFPYTRMDPDDQPKLSVNDFRLINENILAHRKIDADIHAKNKEADVELARLNAEVHIKTSKRYRSLSPDRPHKRRNWDEELNLPPDTRTINPWTAASMPGNEEEENLFFMPAHKRAEIVAKAREAYSTIGSPVQGRRGVDFPPAMGGTDGSKRGVDLPPTMGGTDGSKRGVDLPFAMGDGVEQFPPFEGHSVSRHRDRKFSYPNNFFKQIFDQDDKPRGQTRGRYSKRGKTTGTSKSKPQAASASVDADGNQMMAGSDCTNCGGVHDEQDCTANCGACGRSGHTYNDCRNSQDRCRCKPFPCHLTKDCRERCAKRNGCVDSTHHRAVQCTYRCVICGKFGHPAMKCQYFCPCRKDHFGLEHVAFDKDKEELIDPGCMVVGCGQYFCDEHCMECGQPPHLATNCPFKIRKDWTRGTRPRPSSSRSKNGTVRTLLCTTHESSSFPFGKSCEKCKAEKNETFRKDQADIQQKEALYAGPNANEILKQVVKRGGYEEDPEQTQEDTEVDLDLYQ
jgi:hypothetical protein